MATFAFVKLVNNSVDGRSEVKVAISKIHKFKEVTHHPFQEYKVDLKNGSVGLGTILFLAKTEKEIDNMIAKGLRIRPPNKKFLKAAVDTTDSEVEDKRKQVIKRNYSKQPTNALENRMKLLSEREARNKNFEASSVKKCKIIVSQNKNGKELKAAKALEEKRADISPMKEVDQNVVSRHATCLSVNSDIMSNNTEMQSQNRIEEKTPEKENSFQSGSTTVSSGSRRKTSDQSSLSRTTLSKTSMGKDINTGRKYHSDNSVFESGFKNYENTALWAEKSSLRNKETSFHKLMVSKKQSQSDQNSINEERKSSKLTAEITRFKELLKKEREKTLEQQKKINFLEDKLNVMKKNIEETEKELKMTKDLNRKWQKVGINKCGTMHATINEIKKANAVGRNNYFPPVGHITEDRSAVHMGRDEWISYDTYTLAMHGVTYKSRRTFPKNLCVGVFGYDVLSRSTVSGKGSNRNGNTKQPEERLDPNKLLAIRDIYRHFLITSLHVSEEVADTEAFKVNQCISRKISSVKDLQNSSTKPTRRLVGAPSIEERDPSPVKEIIGSPVEILDVPSVGYASPSSEQEYNGPPAEELVTFSNEERDTWSSEELAMLSEEDEGMPSEDETELPDEPMTDPLSEPLTDSMSEAPTDLLFQQLSEGEMSSQ